MRNEEVNCMAAHQHVMHAARSGTFRKQGEVCVAPLSPSSYMFTLRPIVTPEVTSSPFGTQSQVGNDTVLEKLSFETQALLKY